MLDFTQINHAGQEPGITERKSVVLDTWLFHAKKQKSSNVITIEEVYNSRFLAHVAQSVEQRFRKQEEEPS